MWCIPTELPSLCFPLGFSIRELDEAIRAWAARLGPPTEWALRLILAAALGSLVGLEREIRGRQAGFRTNLLVCLGTALAMIVSVAFTHVPWPAASGFHIQIDPARVAYGVMGGIGFLGAGVIVKHAGTVRGLTTAAGMWCVAAIGLACGLGLYLIAIVATALVVLALWYLDYLERLLPKTRYRTVTVRCAWRPGIVAETIALVQSAGEAPRRVDVKDATWERIGDDLAQIDIRLRISFPNRSVYHRVETELERRGDLILIASTSDMAGEGPR